MRTHRRRRRRDAVIADGARLRSGGPHPRPVPLGEGGLDERLRGRCSRGRRRRDRRRSGGAGSGLVRLLRSRRALIPRDHHTVSGLPPLEVLAARVGHGRECARHMRRVYGSCAAKWGRGNLGGCLHFRDRLRWELLARWRWTWGCGRSSAYRFSQTASSAPGKQDTGK